MNIKEAKEQIKNAMISYFTKDEFGDYVIPIEKQRPVFLIGAPGIGKTAIMEQIAAELDVGLVSYSMTHHTRQSALGLPFIVKKSYGGKEYDVSEYTMSEIIASVYDMIESTGRKEGILFLDEINCVSETLAPAMLQFLQYKIFGRHRVPAGWIVVTAGNPPEFNNSVREFDIVTWDRLKRIDVMPDYEVWKEYAYNKGVHASITTYLEIKKSDFYCIETTVDGKSFVTARGWSDLSDMIKLYEQNNIIVNESLVAQYIQNKKIAKSFAIYYDLFRKYRSDYQVDEILSGKVSTAIKARAMNAKFDERLSLLGLMLDAILGEIKDVVVSEQIQTELLKDIQSVKLQANGNADLASNIEKRAEQRLRELERAIKASSVTPDGIYVIRKTAGILNEMAEKLRADAPRDVMAGFARLKEAYTALLSDLRSKAKRTGTRLSNIFKFCEEVFGDGQEILILVTELTISSFGAKYISRYGCAEYFKHNKGLLLHERQLEIINELDILDLD